MSEKKELKPTASHLPVDSLSIQEKIKRDLAEASLQTEATNVERVRMSGKGFKIPGDAEKKAVQSIKGVIVDFISCNMHYPHKWDADNPSPPNCFAMGRIPKDMVPDTSSSEVQHEACNGCPKNEWESGEGKAKACKNTRSLAFIQEGADMDSPVYVIAIPPSSIRYFDTYVSTTLKGRYQLPPIGVVTEVFMDPNIEFAAPRFKVERTLSEEELEMYYARKEEASAILFQKPSTA
jgi:hypothetical protein